VREAVDKRRVVLVEDNEDTARLLQELLRRLGHEVQVASDGRVGRDLILSARPDVALIDLGLPELDGYQVAEALRRSSVSTRLVALSGYGSPDVQARARRAGFDRHLTKPVTSAELGAVLGAGR
jgi:CheY-like chemotaxis protein